MPPQGRPCPSATSREEAYTLALTKLKVFPDSIIFKYFTSLEEAQEMFEQLAVETPGLNAICSIRSHALGKSGCNIDLPQTIRDGVARSRREARGVCLECELDSGNLIDEDCDHNDVFRA